MADTKKSEAVSQTRSVKLAHYWTDPDGREHAPGETVDVIGELADALERGGMIEGKS